MNQDRQQGAGPETRGGAAPVDVAVAGAGVTGLAVALAIKSCTTLPCTVAVCDAVLGSEPGSGLRAVAVAADARRLLERLGAWAGVADHAQPITAMDLTDTRVGAVPPPVYLRFDGDIGPGEPFAHMVLQDALQSSLLQAGRARGLLLVPHAVSDCRVRDEAVDLDLKGGTGLAARLLVAADGGRSQIRERAGISTVGWDYGQAAIVATLAHSNPHGGRATQHFLPAGPLALLPLRAADGSDRRTSIVWTEERAAAIHLAALPEQAFLDALERRIGRALGTTRLEDRPRVAPLRMALARRMIGPRLALAGDAARTIHPLAGQGLNLGLRDAAVLGREVAQSLDLGLDPASARVLQSYQQACRPGSVAMAAMTDGLNRLFSNDTGLLRELRDLGLGLVDRSPALKRRLIREAAGFPRGAHPLSEPNLSASRRP